VRTRLEIKDLLRPIFARPYSEEAARQVSEIITASVGEGFSVEDVAELAVEALSEARPVEAAAFTIRRGRTPKEAMREELGIGPLN